ncbi:hypothetical protein QAD02_016854 [Eretmocerus hayati]|uniref:Uncharacterized protein n=1 Tax=Eretmocerus hayati TaxID=131215 RepID=A0ACC2PCN6_9HYME|nr:hypothetical protein QAD02_016854 [Eretmocerus hayati]
MDQNKRARVQEEDESNHLNKRFKLSLPSSNVVENVSAVGKNRNNMKYYRYQDVGAVGLICSIDDKGNERTSEKVIKRIDGNTIGLKRHLKVYNPKQFLEFSGRDMEDASSQETL